MPFCPNCHDEFQDWVKVCPDCGVELVEQLQHEVVLNQITSEHMSEKLVTVADYHYSTVAHLSQAKLESEGIPSLIFDEYIINANWFYLIAIGGVKLKVYEKDVAEAVYILREVHNSKLGLAEQPEEGCPKCRSLCIRYETFHVRRTYLIMAISAFFGANFALLLPLFFKRKWKCNNCGYEWRNKKDFIQIPEK